jgi:hypothetical protein
MRRSMQGLNRATKVASMNGPLFCSLGPEGWRRNAPVPVNLLVPVDLPALVYVLIDSYKEGVSPTIILPLVDARVLMMETAFSLGKGWSQGLS